MDEDAALLALPPGPPVFKNTFAVRLAEVDWSSSFSVSVLEYRLLQRESPGLETNGGMLTFDTRDTPGSVVEVTGEEMRSHCCTLALLLWLLDSLAEWLRDTVPPYSPPVFCWRYLSKCSIVKAVSLSLSSDSPS